MNPGTELLSGTGGLPLKAFFCLTLSIGSLVLLQFFKNRPWELKALRLGVVLGITGKFMVTLLLYAVCHPADLHSDAAIYYLPQTLRFLDGAVPNRDFASSYSFLFLPLLSPGVSLWHSVGSIAITFLVMETLMIALYVRTRDTDRQLYRWRAALLYTLSPISFYWTAVAGHNGVIIAFFTMVALILANRRRTVAAGVAAAFALLCSKLLAVLSWPAVIFLHVRGWRKAALVPLAAVALTALLPLFGIDVFHPLKKEFGSSTTGTVWFLASEIVPGFRGTWAWQYGPLLLFAVLFLMFFLRYLKSNTSRDNSRRFDAAAAMIAGTNLLFMALSRKSYVFYTTMFLIFLIHSLVGRGAYKFRELLPLAFLGATTALVGLQWPAILATDYHLTDPIVLFLLTLDGTILACYLYYAALCWRLLKPDTRSDPSS